MTSLDRRRVTEMVIAALDLGGDERKSFLDEACGSAGALRAEVESLLSEEEALADGFLEVPAAIDLARHLSSEVDLDKAGPRSIGPYRVLSLLGRGGMGTVYLAEQKEPVERLIALKVIDHLGPGVGSARFTAECRALARLKHTHVATIHDAGFADGGEAFVAMEWVEGSDISTWCDERCLTLEERIRLFLGVCAGVGHAHQKGIIHQDLKPSNVLVAEIDGQPVAKVIDFGIAHLLDDPDSVAPRSQGVVGSPVYMSPEAVGTSGSTDIDTRSDVYSLGVMLYELLVGRQLFDTSGLRLESLLRRVRDGAAMLPPSRRWRELDLDERRRLAALRGAGVRKVERQLRGDLDAVLGKALARRREDRYGSPAELAADLLRHLEMQPVLARQPRPRYLLGRFVRRHLGVVVAVSGLILVLVSGVVARTLEANRANREADRARSALAEARDVSDFLISLFRVADPNRGPEQPVSVHELLDRAEESLATRLAEQPLAQARFLQTIARIAMNLGDFERAATLHAEALAIREREAERGAGVVAEIAESVGQLGVVRRRQGKLDEAESHLERAVRLIEGGRDPNTMALTAAITHLANLHWQQGRFEEAATGHRRALELRRRHLSAHPSLLAESLNNLGVALRDHGRAREAAPVLREAGELFLQTLGEDHPHTAALWLNLAGVEERIGRWTQAEDLLERTWASWSASYGPAHPRTVRARRALATLWWKWERHGEAVSLLRGMLEVQEEQSPGDHLEIAHTSNLLGSVLVDMDELAAGDAALTRAFTLREGVLGADHFTTLRSRSQLVILAWRRGEHDVAEAYFKRLAEECARRFGDRHPRTGWAHGMHGRVLADQGRDAEAERALRLAVEIRRAADDGPTAEIANALVQLGRVLQRRQRPEEAEALLRRATEIRRQVLPEDHPRLAL